MQAPGRQGLSKEDSAGYLVNHMARLFTRSMNAALDPLGLSTGPLGILLELWRSGPLSQNDLVRRLDHEQATIAYTLQRMARDGFVVLRPSERDGRVKLIHLTRKAKALEEKTCALVRAVNSEALSVLAPAERTTFLAMIRRIIAGQCQRSNDGDQERP